MRALDHKASEPRWGVNWRLIIAISLAVGSWAFLIGVIRLTAHLWGG